MTDDSAIHLTPEERARLMSDIHVEELEKLLRYVSPGFRDQFLAMFMRRESATPAETPES